MITFNYDDKTAKQIELPLWTNATESIFAVSDSYLYVKNIVDEDKTTIRKHAAYYIVNDELVPYMEVVIDNEDVYDNFMIYPNN